MGKMAIELSIIVVSYNTKDLLKKCLDSVYQNTSKVNFEIYVVDNNSTDDSVKMVRERFPEVNVIQNRSNLGFARANNQAIRIAKGRYILLLNSDTLVMPDSLDIMAQFMKENSQAGACGAKVIYPNGTPQAMCSVFPNLVEEMFHVLRIKSLFPTAKARRIVGKYLGKMFGKTVGSYLRAYSDLEGPQEIDTPMGACLMLKKEVIDKVGPLDEKFFMYREDVDLCLRIKQGGWKNYLVPEAEVIHYVGQSEETTNRDSLFQRYKSRYYYYYKHYGLRKALIFKCIILSGLSLRLPIFGLTYLVSNCARKKKIGKLMDMYLRVIQHFLFQKRLV